MNITDSHPPTALGSFRKYFAFLNVEPGEERLIGLLVLLYFIMELGFVFLQSMAFGVFITEYSVQGLPYSYISIAFLASLAAVLYIKIGGRVSFSNLLFINLIFLGVISLLIWLALKSPLYHATAFILPLWFQIAINLGTLAIWPLAGSLFNFRQGKRLFPLLGAGGWLSNIVGGLFIPALVKAVGVLNLVLLAAITFGVSIVILRTIARDYLKTVTAETPTGQPVQRTTSAPKRQQGIFKDRYVLLIFAYVFIWWVSFFFVENMFYDRAFAQYPDADQLAAFIGQFLSVMGIAALITSTVVSSRVIARFGLRAGFGVEAVLVTLGVSAFAFFGTLGSSSLIVFALIAFTKLINGALGFSLSQSATVLVYQALPEATRKNILATAEGVLQPIAIGFAGLSLLGLTSGLKFTYLGLSYVYQGLGVAWLVTVFLLSGNYVHALTQAITKRRLGDSANALADLASISLLRSHLQDSHPGVVIYALNKLEILDIKTVHAELPNLIRHPAPEVRREAFHRVEKLKLRSMLNEVKSQLTIETAPSVKESALRALGAISEDKSQLIHALNETDINSLRGALIGLLKYGNDTYAQQKLKDLLASNSNENRNLTIEVMGEVDRREFYPQIIKACDSPKTGRSAGLALVAIGEAMLPEIGSAFSESDAPCQRLLILSRVLGRIGGIKSQTILCSRMSEPDNEVRSQILTALSQSGYRTKDIGLTQRAVKAEAEGAAWVSAAQVDLGNTSETTLLMKALDQFHAQIRSRALLLLSFVFGDISIRRVQEALTAGSSTQVSYALEIMDTQLPADWKPWVMPLLEDLAPKARSESFAAFFHHPKRTPEERLLEINENLSLPFWVRACAVYAAKKGDPAMLSTVEKVLILKSVQMFGQTPDNVLADVAELLEEMDVAENTAIFKQGDEGDSLYIILDGKVRVHDGERLLNYLGERDVFGEMALLDPEPRLASVTAMESTRLFRLNQAPFYELMAERPEVATGIIRVLTGHLRDRIHDIGRLNARIQELEDHQPR
jgi:hypothetical protein